MKSKSIFFFFFLFMLLSGSSYAQCAMCRTTAESDLKTGGTSAKGLNTGILYLMAMPYIIVMTGGYFFFKKPIDQKLKNWKLKHFPSK